MWSIGSRAACSNDFKSWGCKSFEACEVEVSRCEGASFEVFGGRRRFRLWPLLGTFAPEASRYRYLSMTIEENMIRRTVSIFTTVVAWVSL